MPTSWGFAPLPTRALPLTRQEGLPPLDSHARIRSLVMRCAMLFLFYFYNRLMIKFRYLHTERGRPYFSASCATDQILSGCPTALNFHSPLRP